MTHRFISTIAALCAILASAIPASAEYPVRPITLIVPAAAGGFNDVIVRIVAEHMTKTLGQPIIIENDAGAGGTNVAQCRQPRHQRVALEDHRAVEARAQHVLAAGYDMAVL